MLVRGVYRIFLLGILLAFTFSSCSLIKSIKETEPLTKGELNRRLLVQEYVRLSGSKIEKAADSIIDYAEDSEVKSFAYLWKLKSLQAYNNAAFQTSPDLALLDTWTLTKQFDDFIRSDRGKMRYRNWYPLVLSVTTKNLRELEAEAAELLSAERYNDYRELVYRYAEQHPLTNLRFVDQTLRKEYLAYKGLPDSSAVKTVGTLPQVVSDWANRLQYNSQSSVKGLKWNTEMAIVKGGWDTINLNQRFEKIDEQVANLMETAEELPDRVEGSIDTISNRMRLIMDRVEYDIDEAKAFIKSERESIDSMVARERIALDTIVARERAAVLTDVGTITESTLEKIDGILWKLLVVMVLLFVILITVFFMLGYYVRHSMRSRAKPENEKEVGPQAK